MNYNVTVIPGDGIGPEIVREARKVLDQVGKVFGHSFDYTEILMGGCSIDAYGVPLTEEALETARKSDAVLTSGPRQGFWLSARGWGCSLISGRLIFIRNWLRPAL